MTATETKPQDLGPAYPTLGPTVAAHRRKAGRAGSISAMAPEDRKAYGAAVLAGFATLASKIGSAPSPRCPCASGTWESSPAAIQSAIRRQHVAQLQAGANADRRRRTDREIADLYEKAMAEKRARLAAPPAALPAAPPAALEEAAPDPAPVIIAPMPKAAKARRPRPAPAPPAWQPFQPLRFTRPALRAMRA